MGDVEAAGEALLDRAAQLVRIGARRGGYFQRDQGLLLGQGPGMEMRDVGDALDFGDEVCLDILGVEPDRRAFEQDVTGFAGNAHAGKQDQQGDQHRQDRVGGHPARGHDDDGGANGGDGAEQVARDMPERALQVQVFLAAAMQDGEGENVDQQAADGDDHEDIAHHLDRVEQAVDGLPDDPERKQDQKDAIGEGGEDLHPREAIGALRVGRALGQLVADPGEGQRARIGQHVRSVRQEGQRAGDQAAGHFGEHEGGCQQAGNRDAAAGIGTRHVGIMVMAVAMIVVMLVRVAGGMCVIAHDVLMAGVGGEVNSAVIA